MRHADGSLIRCAVAAAWLLALAAPAAAQQMPSPTPAGPGFLTRYDFHLTGTALAIDDARFTWTARFGGDLDLIDYVAGRATITADYETVLGDELRPFDPIQGNYILEAAASLRAGRTEIVGVFHHVSRHLGDRPKVFAIAWNTLGARVLRRWSMGATTLDVNVDGARVVQKAFVDYSWIGQADVVLRRTLSPRAGVFVHGMGQTFGVDPLLARRERQTGGLVEGGVRLEGSGAAMELFAGYERRVDADAIDRRPQHWAMAGFRLLGR